ncbi:MAG: hypothetical protein ACPG9R_04710 [Marinobacter salsuginis]
MVASISCCLRVSLTPTFGMAASVSRLDSGVEKQRDQALLLLIERSINKKVTEVRGEIQTCLKSCKVEGHVDLALRLRRETRNMRHFATLNIGWRLFWRRKIDKLNFETKIKACWLNNGVYCS